MSETGSSRDRPGNELSVSVARERFADIVNNAAYRDEITYVTRHGKRVAAVTPISVLEGGIGHDDIPRRGTGAALLDLIRRHTAAYGIGDSSWAEEHEEARRAEITQESVWDEG
jgi:prevent-host-death family protein